MSQLDPNNMNVRELLFHTYQKIESMEKSHDDFKEHLSERLDNHGKRIKSIETWRTLLHGAGIVIASGVGFIWHSIKEK